MQQRDRLHQLLLPRLLIATAALIAVLPLILYGPSCGHDFDFHILNWLEAAQQFAHGTFHPSWAYTPAYNAGEPRFVFYPPLSWTIGAILGLTFPWQWTPILYTWLVLTAAGLALHRLARSFTTPAAATLAAVFYLVNPYMLFTVYERTAYAELLAAVWIPLLLHSILRPEGQGGVTIPRIALPVALLWLTNAPAAVMSCYALALLTVVRLVTTRRSRTKLAFTTAAGTTLGLALASFYILPAAYERRYVQITMAILPGLRIQDNFLFHHLAATVTDPAALPDALLHDTVLHTASLIAITLIILTITALFLANRAGCPMIGAGTAPIVGLGTPHNSSTTAALDSSLNDVAHRSRKQPAVLLPLTILTLAIAFLLIPLSAPIWNHAPELAFLQFPWRILAILAAVLSLTIALALRNQNLKPTATALISLAIAAALTIPAYKAFHQTCDEEDTVPSRVELFHSNRGTEPTDEYTPITADNDALAHNNPSYWLSPNPAAPPPANTQPGPAPTHLNFTATQPGFLILNLRDYPAWKVTSKDSNSIALDVPNHIHREDGLITLPIYYPADYRIDITLTRTLDQTVGYFISLLAAIALISFILFKRVQTPPTT